MGGWCSSSAEESSDRAAKTDEADGEFKGPVTKRSCTDVQFLVLFIIFIAVWAGLIGYCVTNGNIFRIIRGFDDCGHVCGHVTPLTIDVCPGANLTTKKYLKIHRKEDWSVQKKECVESCDVDENYKQYWNRCIPKGEETLKYSLLSRSDLQSFFQEAAEDLHNSYWEILYLCLLALVLSIVLVGLFRYFAGFLVWLTLIGILVVSVGTSVYLWVAWKQKKDMLGYNLRNGEHDERNASTKFGYAVIATIVTIVIALLIFGMRKSIALVAQLFEESGKAVQDMPLLLGQPFLTFCVIAASLLLWFNCYLWIESAGFPEIKPGTNRVHYKKDEVIQFARWYNVVALFWIVQFLLGCQHMIISGAVATWFFTRNKETVKSPIGKSYSNMTKYHLGTIAFGSLILTIIKIIRALFKIMNSTVKDAKHDFTKTLAKGCNCCLYVLEKFLVYLSRNAYIEVAIYGENLWKSGQRAFKVLVSNSMKVIAINSVGDFVLFLGEALIVTTTVFVGFKVLDGKNIHHLAVPLTVIGIFAYFVAHSFMAAFEMVIDTIFICFCEDCELNDGGQRPYYMNKGLMEFVENSQKVLKVGDAAAEPKE